jgi:hypothetical protein
VLRSDIVSKRVAVVPGRGGVGAFAVCFVGMFVACGGSGCLRDTDCASHEQCTLGACVDRPRPSDGGASAGGASAEAQAAAGNASLQDAGLCPCEAAICAQQGWAGAAGAGGAGGAAGGLMTDDSSASLAGYSGSAGFFGMAGLGGNAASEAQVESP